jgi:hypothetical protein
MLGAQLVNYTLITILIATYLLFKLTLVYLSSLKFICKCFYWTKGLYKSNSVTNYNYYLRIILSYVQKNFIGKWALVYSVCIERKVENHMIFFCTYDKIILTSLVLHLLFIHLVFHSFIGSSFKGLERQAISSKVST